MLGANRPQFVDVAIMGAVSLHGIRTPLLGVGGNGNGLRRRDESPGVFSVGREGSAVGDASSLKLLRSLFAKGLDALVVELMLAAEALGLRQDLIELLSDFDQRPLRDHIDMYLRTHPPHAGRRLVEMELAEEQMKSLGLRSLTTRATIDRYRHTTDLVRRSGALPAMDAPTALQRPLDAERGRPGKEQ